MPIRHSRYLQLDVFTETAGGGNPLGVVLDAADWTDSEMQGFAAWTDLVETCFLLPPTHPDADYRVRIFTPEKEIPYAGHPSVGSAYAARASGQVDLHKPQLQQECGLGLVALDIANLPSARVLISVQAPKAMVLEQPPLASELIQAAVAGLSCHEPPVLIEGGRRWWLVRASHEADLRHWQAPHTAIGALAKASQSLGLCAFVRAEHEPNQLVVRAFPVGVGINEDPASGAANGMIAAWLRTHPDFSDWHAGYVVSQGREMGHDARIDIAYRNDGIWVGGQVHTVIAGHCRWPV